MVVDFGGIQQWHNGACDLDLAIDNEVKFRGHEISFGITAFCLDAAIGGLLVLRLGWCKERSRDQQFRRRRFGQPAPHERRPARGDVKQHGISDHGIQ